MKYKTNLYTNSQGKIQPMVELETTDGDDIERTMLTADTTNLLIQLRNQVREAGFKLVDDP